ncbi:XisI protein [Anabaena cylindrica FACHB-243]|uniref:XisI protein n=1 Tax=Anabaena cylindrica (strain ATCC 27899 / PCC 7122) TaxID=272123 RepID=K9ZN70_ANACC|nr:MULTISPECIES: XisI protein [Anabaena]AFZ60007.1 XisI protein [Anabaena cylindrica PCC 7122]MBD2417934.1 XisI protein [Anabaena cylindrica FACHB-243]MBY5282485.1 XisI protein [Anabaena sp. CCAP 1446/1C]MBY5309912.1 XisI protein [Anabaena sp. CCAP 1446/1C]MCM2404850.1 XisI protein [Anabaena sp. CCAP 1446/1C]
MENIEQYRTYIQKLLTEYAQGSPSDDEVETQLIFDKERDHYQVVYAGWKNRRPMYGCVLHLDIKNGKIWIQYNGTEIDIANELVKLGVPKEDIVLAFHEPLVRQYTGFAVG